MNIYLIGYRCSGKTSVGKALSARLGWRFFDCDTELVKAAGSSIKEIVDNKGWGVFRELEKDILNRVCELTATVVATGGGVVTDAENVRHMKTSGQVIWLKVEPDTIKERLLQDQTTGSFRPSLSAKGVLKEIEETLACRLPLYESAMDFYVRTDNVAIDSICNSIHEKMKKYRK